MIRGSALYLLSLAAAYGQSFEVASIKPNATNDPWRRNFLAGTFSGQSTRTDRPD